MAAEAKKLPSGNLRCRAYYTDELGNYKSKSFTAKTKKEAERKSALFLMEYEHFAIQENKTLAELADIFIENRSNLLSPSTIAGYRKIRRNAFQDIVNIRTGLLTKELYQQAINNYSKGRSAKTVFNAHTFYNRVLKNNDIRIGEHVILPQKQKIEKRIPTTNEIIGFLNFIKETRIYLLTLFAVSLGLRRSEIIAIKWKDIDFEKKLIVINKARVSDEYGMLVEKDTKTYSGTRTLKAPNVLLSALPEKGNDNDYIINESIPAIESLYKRLARKADFPYTFHSLRHYYASALLLSGVPNKYATERMGHATENMLQQVYQHTFKDKQNEIDELMDNYMEVFNTNK